METIKNPVYIDVLIPLMVIIFIIGVGVVLLYQHFQKNLFIHKLKQETLKANYHNDLLRSNIKAEEEERKRIAQDLHDEMGAVLSIMRMNLVLLEHKASRLMCHLPRDLKMCASLPRMPLPVCAISVTGSCPRNWRPRCFARR